MSPGEITILKCLRKFYVTFSNQQSYWKRDCILDPELASKIIYDGLMSDEPFMIARFGSTELTCILNYTGIMSDRNKYYSYIKGESQPWWWESKIIQQMSTFSGFFPATEEKIIKFCELMLEDIPEVDVLGSWIPQENVYETQLQKSIKIDLELLNPYFAINPWTKALTGKKVLVIHPFANTITEQYAKRHLIFNNEILPNFELQTIKAIQGISGNNTEFTDWFEALDFMKSKIDQCDYDICLIGAGAYGFPLAAHVKRAGKKAVHLGGSLQLLFGIKGRRWENPNYHPKFNYVDIMNDYWVRPSAEETPSNASAVENACYW